MAAIIFIGTDGKEYRINAEHGRSLMEVAYQNSVPGIVAECGGACACATCHIYVDSSWIKALPEKDGMEEAMLDMALERRDNSRLSCQLIVTEAMDGLIVRVGNNESL